MITLTDEDRAWCYAVAEAQRGGAKERNQWDPGSSKVNTHFIGNLCELVFGRDYDLEWDPKFEPDDGYDYILNGYKVDVKSAPPLKIWEHQLEHDVDVFVGVHLIDDHTFEVLGFIARDDVQFNFPSIVARGTQFLVYTEALTPLHLLK